MNPLALFLSVVFTGFFEFISKYIGKKIALSAAAIATFIVSLVALWLVIRGLILALMWTWPPVAGTVWGSFYLGLSLGLPANLEVIISAYISADLAIFLYRWNHENVFKVPLYIT
jgi:Family of unknown function (DUF5455)